MEDTQIIAQNLCDLHVRLLCFKVGYSRKTHEVTEKGRASSIYKSNLSHIQKALEEGYTSKEIEEVLRQYKNYHTELKFVHKLFPIPKKATTDRTDNIIYLKEEESHTHPDLFLEGKLIPMVEKKNIFNYLIGRVMPQYRDTFKAREIGALDYLLKNFTIDEVLYMGDIAASKGDDLDTLLDLQRYTNMALDAISFKKNLLADLQETIQRSIGSAQR